MSTAFPRVAASTGVITPVRNNAVINKGFLFDSLLGAL
jgi:hypothetical protein